MAVFWNWCEKYIFWVNFCKFSKHIIFSCSARGKYVNMKSNNLKLSTSRKSLHRLSSRQKNRIRFEINQNFSRYKKLNNVSDIQNNIQDISEPSTSVGCNRSNNFINDIRHERERERHQYRKWVLLCCRLFLILVMRYPHFSILFRQNHLFGNN